MRPRITAIAFILICTSLAWFILAATIDHRTVQSDGKLRSGVDSVWGSPQEQEPPSASYQDTQKVVIQSEAGGHQTAQTDNRVSTVQLPIESSRIDAGLKLEYRQKGLLWYSTYVVDFDGRYKFHNSSDVPKLVTFAIKFPAQHAIYDGLVMEVNGQPLSPVSGKQGATAVFSLPPHDAATFRIGYRSHGLDSWTYQLGDDSSEARDFLLMVHTNFKDIDFPLNTLSPSEKHETRDGWNLVWRYSNLISGFQIGLSMPQHLQPGPLAGEISYFAPVSLLLFFFVIFMLTTLRRIDLHPMNYFFLAAAFFAFHLLLAYLVDHISIHLAFLICSVVSIFLVTTYLRLVVGPRFALIQAGGAQFVYLVLFSCAFFLQGFTGLAVAIGCIVTLFVAMQMTARIRWAERFRSASPLSPAPGS
jgi:Inner membrane protein CreD